MHRYADNMKLYMYIKEIWREAVYMIYIAEDMLT
jgi:hypothetical protein